MIEKITKKELNYIRDRLCSRYPLEKIILFGSQATGTADEKSDIDLLLILDFEGKRRQLMVEIYRVIDHVQHAVDFLILTPDEFIQEKKIPGTIGKYAAEQGTTIYERAA